MTPDEVLPLLIGPYGALILAVVVMWFLYRLYREERRDGREDRKAMTTLVDVVKEQTNEIRMMRERLSMGPQK